MPFMHNVNIKDLKLSDFPQFSCLCELCDCGCFDRGKNEHSDTCKTTKKKKSKRSSVLSDNDSDYFDSRTLYNDSYKRIDLSKLKLDPLPSLRNPSISGSDVSLNKVRPRETISIGDKNERVSTHTTSKEHFKYWDTKPASLVLPQPDIAANLMYPDHNRQFMTTNERMYYKNYGNFQAEPNSRDLFANTFKINHGKMTMNSTYKQDFKKVKKEADTSNTIHYDDKIIPKYRRIPMLMETQTKSDYRYDPEKFHSIYSSRDVSKSTNLFKSHLNENFQPFLYENNNVVQRDSPDRSKNDRMTLSPVSVSSSNYKSSIGGEKTISYATSFDNTLIPTIRVMNNNYQELPSKYSKIPAIGKSSKSSVISDIDDNASTYQSDFNKQGNDICMAKAFKLVSNKQNSKSNNSLVMVQD